jgi:AraC-like DNA-binding protein
MFALADPRLRAAIEAMHAQPARRWTLSQLAAVAGQSRSAFALHFRKRVGVTPLDYLLRWRMRLATRRLKGGSARITLIAQALGYDSDSAFSHAFKRVMACSPRQYRLHHAGAQA